tara:strand:- start:1887 stop:2258 length:372 start_codon:yes stop_codon:yes gene_type:complete
MNDTSILLVDDDNIVNFLSERILTKMDFNNITAVTDGTKAWKNINEKCVDLVFLDINMPVMNGFDFLTKQAKELLCDDMNVVILTSSNRKSDRDQASQFKSVIGFIEKPLSQDKVQQVLEKIK